METAAGLTEPRSCRHVITTCSAREGYESAKGTNIEMCFGPKGQQLKAVMITYAETGEGGS
eukprot:9111360-Pyramimonas_sp.AAC.1